MIDVSIPEDEMATEWTVPEYRRGEVDRAGRVLGSADASREEKDAAWVVGKNWRSSHAYPLNHFTTLLRQKAANAGGRYTISQRQKRRAAIELKLTLNTNMQLSQMHDLGGCRAVLLHHRKVRQVVKMWEASRSKHELVKKYDYLDDRPRDTGYRGVHLVYRYNSDTERGQPFNNLRIEIQLRSELQHAWATAVEIAGMFTGEALKSNRGSKDWLRFFALMGAACARREKTAPVPNTPTDKPELVAELRQLTGDLNVIARMDAWAKSIKAQEEDVLPGARYFQLDFNALERQVSVFGYNTLEEAQASVGAREGTSEDTVLVSVKDIAELRRAYPNYYLNSTEFVGILRWAIGRGPKSMSREPL